MDILDMMVCVCVLNGPLYSKKKTFGNSMTVWPWVSITKQQTEPHVYLSCFVCHNDIIYYSLWDGLIFLFERESYFKKYFVQKMQIFFYIMN